MFYSLEKTTYWNFLTLKLVFMFKCLVKELVNHSKPIIVEFLPSKIKFFEAVVSNKYYFTSFFSISNFSPSKKYLF